MGPMWIKLVVQSPIERGAVSDTKIEAQLVKSPTVSGHITQLVNCAWMDPLKKKKPQGLDRTDI